MAKAAAPEKESFWRKLRMLGTVFALTAKRDKLFIPLLVGAVALAALFTLLVLLAFGLPAFWWILVLPFGLAGVMLVLNVRSSRMWMRELEGNPGAASQLIKTMRGDWRVTEAVAATTQNDVVHLVLGRPGVILIGEGNPARVRSMLGQEKRRLAKVIGSTDMRDLIIGNGEGEVPLGKLRTTLMKLPRTITAREMNALETRLRALTSRPQMPKGAIPKNMRPSNLRIPRR